MKKRDLDQVIKRYCTGKATVDDELLLFSWYNTLHYNNPMEIADSDRINDLDDVLYAIRSAMEN